MSRVLSQSHLRPRSLAAAKPRSDYTLAHAGRQIRFGPILFWSAVLALVIMALWSAITATYFAFRDDVLTKLIVRQAQMQYAYEDRIADLRTQVDRLTGRQLLDQDQFEQKLEQLLRRQSTLESRAATLATLPDTAPTGSLRGRAPEKQKLETDGKADRRSQLGKTGLTTAMTRIENALDQIEKQQVHALSSVEENYDNRAKRMRAALTELGLERAKPPAPPARSETAIGGPFVPVHLRAGATSFERQLYRVTLARADLDRLTKTLAAIPLRKPMSGDIDTTSGYGMRLDPFLKAPAMHTGLDFRGDSGDPIRATAAGKVVQAGWNGGYGKLVEIDHGNGLTTRYGHLSTIDVEEGASVRIGQTIGHVGSTGRSTGPHLHYETRVDGDAVDPQKFLRAGARLAQ